MGGTRGNRVGCALDLEDANATSSAPIGMERACV